MLRWKKKYLSQGINGLKPAYRKIDPALRDLEEENERLKKIIARQALELEVKSELLKNFISNQDKKMIVQSHESITTLENLLSWVDLSKSSFYYKSSDGKRGAKPSVCTFRQDGTQVDDTLVIEEIKAFFLRNFVVMGTIISQMNCERWAILSTTKRFID